MDFVVDGSAGPKWGESVIMDDENDHDDGRKRRKREFKDDPLAELRNTSIGCKEIRMSSLKRVPLLPDQAKVGSMRDCIDAVRVAESDAFWSDLWEEETLSLAERLVVISRRPSLASKRPRWPGASLDQALWLARNAEDNGRYDATRVCCRNEDGLEAFLREDLASRNAALSTSDVADLLRLPCFAFAVRLRRLPMEDARHGDIYLKAALLDIGRRIEIRSHLACSRTFFDNMAFLASKLDLRPNADDLRALGAAAAATFPLSGDEGNNSDSSSSCQALTPSARYLLSVVESNSSFCSSSFVDIRN